MRVDSCRTQGEAVDNFARVGTGRRGLARRQEAEDERESEEPLETSCHDLTFAGSREIY